MAGGPWGWASRARFFASLWMVCVALLLAAAVVVLAGTSHRLPLPGFTTMLVRRYWTYSLWALLQQFLLWISSCCGCCDCCLEKRRPSR